MENISPAGGLTWAAIQRPIKRPYRILVVDDEPDIRSLNTEVLMDSGYQVEAAANGAVAWLALNTRKYDLLITDHNMPMVTGLQLIKKLRAENMTLPVILMSATLPTEELALHPWLQIQATLQKPYTLEELLATVKKVLHATTARAGEQLTPVKNWQTLPAAIGRRAVMGFPAAELKC